MFDVICKMDNGYNAKRYSSSIFLVKIKERKIDFEKIKNNTNRAIDIVNKEIRTSTDLSYKESMNKILNGLNNQNSLVDSLFSLYKDINFADNRLNMIRDNTTKSLFKLINDDYNALYNNAFESTIQNLVLVSLMRGHDIQQDTIALSQYRRDKHSYYNLIITPAQRSTSDSSDIDILFDMIFTKQEVMIEVLLQTIKKQELLSRLRNLIKSSK